ncbi:MAG: hypothetical protein ACRDA4_08035 [Filifactoraceae bacterium]
MKTEVDIKIEYKEVIVLNGLVNCNCGSTFVLNKNNVKLRSRTIKGIRETYYHTPCCDKEYVVYKEKVDKNAKEVL